MSRASLIMTILLACSPALASAQAEQQPADSTLRLSDDEKAELLSRHTEESVDAARSGLGATVGFDRRTHGEVGALIGSHGTRAAYGTATVPLGENSQATVSLERSRSDRPY